MKSARCQELFNCLTPFVATNGRLREPQRDAYQAVRNHFACTNAPALVQIPVGCGKTGLLSILPFGIATGRVLLVAPNVTIRENVFRAVDSASKHCFWRIMGVAPLTPSGPFAAHIDGPDTNLADLCESHFVVSNVQQVGQANKWLDQLPSDFFDMILIDEGHHNVAQSWKRLVRHFSQAKVVSVTATPFRSDGRTVIGAPVYRYPYLRAMCQGYITSLNAVHVAPTELSFTMRDGNDVHTCTLKDVLRLRESTWFRRGVALAEKCNEHIVSESIQQCEELRANGKIKHQIIAAACSVEHAKQIACLYRRAGYATEEIHSGQTKQTRDNVISRLRSAQLDAIVQVQMLGEGFDHPPLSVAAVFRPFRTLSPYVQFVGRIMRTNQQDAPGAPDNRGVVVSHVGLNTERHWKDFKGLDEGDQQLFASLVGTRERSSCAIGSSIANDSPDAGSSQSISPNMLVKNELLGEVYRSQYGNTEQQQRQLKLESPHHECTNLILAGPQQRRRESRSRLQSEVQDAIRDALFEWNLYGRGWQISRKFQFLRGYNNWVALRFWIFSELNQAVKRKPRRGKEWSLDEVEEAMEVLPQVLKNIHQKMEHCFRRKKQWPKYGKSLNT